jgi:glycosyltransferase involved in cell wall biosynthesis
VPLVSTRVGQVSELAEGAAWLVDVEDAEGLAEGLARAREGGESTRAEVERGREVAERHALELLDPLWDPVLDPLARR